MSKCVFNQCFIYFKLKIKNFSCRFGHLLVQLLTLVKANCWHKKKFKVYEVSFDKCQSFHYKMTETSSLSFIWISHKIIWLVIDELSLQLVNTEPSHHTVNEDTWIDILPTDNNDIIVSHERKLPTFPIRHGIISVTIEIFRPELSAGS